MATPETILLIKAIQQNFWTLRKTLADFTAASTDFDIDAKDALGYAPLHHAAAKGDYDSVRLLIKNGAKLTEVDLKGKTALHYAAANGFHKIAEYILDTDPSTINAQDINGATPVMIAISESKKSTSHLLLSRQFNPQICDDSSNSLMHYASFSKLSCLFDIISKIQTFGVSINTQNGALQTPLHCCALAAPQNIEALLLNGADANIRDCLGQTALHHVMKKKNLSAAITLTMNGADWNISDNRGIYPIDYKRNGWETRVRSQSRLDITINDF